MWLFLVNDDILVFQTDVWTASGKIRLDLKMFMNFNKPTEFHVHWANLGIFRCDKKAQSKRKTLYKLVRAVRASDFNPHLYLENQ